MSTQEDKLREIFFEALGKASREDQRYLATACSQDQELRRQVESRFEAHEQAADFLNQGPVAGRLRISEGPGTVIGRYKLLEKIGEGGMGVDYMAEQWEPVVRKVALTHVKLTLRSGAKFSTATRLGPRNRRVAEIWLKNRNTKPVTVERPFGRSFQRFLGTFLPRNALFYLVNVDELMKSV